MHEQGVYHGEFYDCYNCSYVYVYGFYDVYEIKNGSVPDVIHIDFERCSEYGPVYEQ
jgi:hypothetical protein